MPDRSRVLVGATLAVAMVMSIFIAARTWERVRTRTVRTIEVTGSAKKRIMSDLVEWHTTVTASHADAAAAYKTLHADVDKVRAYLKQQGVADDAIRPSSIDRQELYDDEVSGSGDDRVEKRVFKGYVMRQTIMVRSTDIALIERLSREVTALIEQGVNVESGQPAYHFTKLSDLKVEMLAEAAKDARTRAERIIASAASGKVGGLRTSDMGVINVNPANSTETSWEGNNDTSSIEKDVITIVHCTFDVNE
jgi:hypothetical protein